LTKIQKALVVIVVTAVAAMTLWMCWNIILWRKKKNNSHSFLIQLLILNLKLNLKTIWCGSFTVLPRIIRFVMFCEQKLLPLLRGPVTKLSEAGWFQNILGCGIENMRNNPNAMYGIVTAVGGGAIFAGIMGMFVTFQTA
jgi:hypothetical protein